jgi:tRNA U34 5-methylaminomethyl-2-thiouridine-forming methyltransferase MnmC
MAEAQALYIEQLELPRRFAEESPERGFVVWDVGLGAAANVLTLLRALEGRVGLLQVFSFDHTLQPLAFALQHTAELPYLAGFEKECQALIDHGEVSFVRDGLKVEWKVRVADFPSLISSPAASAFPHPHAIMYDAFSPARNPAMWTQPVFAAVHRCLSPNRPCALPTYSRSTILRVTLLLAGFYVGVGHPTGEKEETTIAANHLALLKEPLDRRFLERARRSHSAEPMWTPEYEQRPLAESTWAALLAHPQFSGQVMQAGTGGVLV